ncbi:hypothetical protein M422DRAFT_30032 [Sphaerobolus stellatus SS14]|uniref:PSP1 C-terminal domain-containing protein n=1 Tax=Sphaerobolus stellatus (strain SS14) TaxID=990650 RepID=A0A0C9VDP9_SPHS4|nr:hypothetical protein M422DRAFT_30032 [Sphaerobolus stellatus SS14]
MGIDVLSESELANPFVFDKSQLSPWDILLKYILENSDAELALIHDNDFGMFSFEVNTTAELQDMLNKERPRIIVSDSIGVLDSTHLIASRSKARQGTMDSLDYISWDPIPERTQTPPFSFGSSSSRASTEFPPTPVESPRHNFLSSMRDHPRFASTFEYDESESPPSDNFSKTFDDRLLNGRLQSQSAAQLDLMLGWKHKSSHSSEVTTDFSNGLSPMSRNYNASYPVSVPNNHRNLASSPDLGLSHAYSRHARSPLPSPLTPDNRSSFSNQPPHIPTYLQTHTSRENHSLSGLGKGIPLHAVPSSYPLYIVEFKAGRKDLFYAQDRAMDIREGDLVIVEAHRGKDLGKVINDSITLPEVEAFQKAQADRAAGQVQMGTGDGSSVPPPIGKRDIHPKQIYGKAGSQDTQLLSAKLQDELTALQLCQTKVQKKKLPMEVVDAEYQWDRRRLTFYFIAEKRIELHELVRELFRVYKTRIWMTSLQAPQEQ